MIHNGVDIPIDFRAESLLKRLEAAGYEAYVVGGCVRDSMLCRVPKDWDICTSATPDQVKSVFQNYKVIETGIQHGTVTVLCDGVPHEITTYRVDGEYSDGRHPDSVKFTSLLKDDLSRRDFTVNAMAYNPRVGLVDYFGGVHDLQLGVIRCVGNADERFKEDALRILRAIRFGCQLDFSIQFNTVEAMYANKESLSLVSRERVCAELQKMLCCHRFPFSLSVYRKIFFELIPELRAMDGFDQNNPYHSHDVFVHTLYAVDHVDFDPVLKLAALFHDIGKPHCYFTGEDGYTHFHGHAKVSTRMAIDILTSLRFDTDTIHSVSQLIHFHDATLVPERPAVKRWLNKLGETQLRRLTNLRRADIKAQSDRADKERFQKLSDFEHLIDEVISSNEAFSLKHLAISGKDLIEMGYREGVQIGIILHELMEAVVEGEVNNTKEDLIIKVKEKFVDEKLVNKKI